LRAFQTAKPRFGRGLIVEIPLEEMATRVQPIPAEAAGIRAGGVFMTGITSGRLTFLLLVMAGSAVCQADQRLPELPPPQAAPDRSFANTTSGDLHSAFAATQFPVSEQAQLDLDRARDLVFQTSSQRESTDPISRYFVPTSAHNSRHYETSSSESLMGRASYAASSLVFTHEEDGKLGLNTHYLLSVLTTAVAHSAAHSYGRRSISQPFGDFGSTVGSDAGMNVFEEFKPGILQLVKSHEPRFLEHIAEHFAHR
jgi:hypothetical protein